DRAPLGGRGLLDRGLELLGQAYVDPRGGAVLGDQQAALRRAVYRRRSVLGREPERLGGWQGHDGVRVAAPQAKPPPTPRHEPGASSRVISSAAADSASSSVIRIADSSDPVRRSTSARASSPPASASVANSCPRLLTYGFRSMVPLWHIYGTNAKQLWHTVAS